MSLVAVIGGVGLLLAAYQVLPAKANAISALGAPAVGLGVGIIPLGFLGILFFLRNLSPEEEESSNEQILQHDLSKPLNRDLNRMQQARVDKKVGSTGWKQHLGKEEKQQTLEAFLEDEATQANYQRRNLQLHILDDQISSEEKDLLMIVAQYLAVTHGLTVEVHTSTSLLSSQYKRNDLDHEQYAVELTMKNLYENLVEDSFSLGFTSYDLYPYTAPLNFCFGVGLWKWASGCFSIYRFKDHASPGTILKRLLKIASHELSHLRGVSHCTRYACNMQGVNSLHETDLAPLIFCAEDMAKICEINHWTLKEGYQKQRNFLDQQKTYRHEFIQDIEELDKRIALL